VAALRELAHEVPVVLPAHPRTRAAVERAGLQLDPGMVFEPLGYVEFLSLVSGARAVLTDSGGLQEETTWLGVPCYTLRQNTERPVTVVEGTNTLLGLDAGRIRAIPQLLSATRPARARVPAGWDGRAAARIVDVLERESR
jgi:UDP-N-acetylglucosamine 2-epimerase (non-hydrolysing)